MAAPLKGVFSPSKVKNLTPDGLGQYAAPAKALETSIAV